MVKGRFILHALLEKFFPTDLVECAKISFTQKSAAWQVLFLLKAALHFRLKTSYNSFEKLPTFLSCFQTLNSVQLINGEGI
jgi:hypothetical protein